MTLDECGDYLVELGKLPLNAKHAQVINHTEQVARQLSEKYKALISSPLPVQTALDLPVKTAGATESVSSLIPQTETDSDVGVRDVPLHLSPLQMSASDVQYHPQGKPKLSNTTMLNYIVYNVYSYNDFVIWIKIFCRSCHVLQKRHTTLKYYFSTRSSTVCGSMPLSNDGSLGIQTMVLSLFTLVTLVYVVVMGNLWRPEDIHITSADSPTTLTSGVLREFVTRRLMHC